MYTERSWTFMRTKEQLLSVHPHIISQVSHVVFGERFPPYRFPISFISINVIQEIEIIPWWKCDLACERKCPMPCPSCHVRWDFFSVQKFGSKLKAKMLTNAEWQDMKTPHRTLWYVTFPVWLLYNYPFIIKTLHNLWHIHFLVLKKCFIHVWILSWTGVSYQWFKDTAENFVRPEHQTYIFISDNGKMYFSEVTKVDEGNYHCVVTLGGPYDRHKTTNFEGKMQSPSRTSLPIPLFVLDSGEFWVPRIKIYEFTFFKKSFKNINNLRTGAVETSL